MRRWWDFFPSKPIWLQNGLGRIVCRFAGHEKGRSQWCDWCGKDLDAQA